MNLKDIEKIVKLMDAHQLTQFKLEQDDTKLELKKGGDIDVEAVQKLMAQQQPMMMQQQPMQAAPAQPAGGSQDAPATSTSALPAGIEEIKSLMPGTFYAASKPESPPFVAQGDKVEKETVVCIIEAMKVMNEVMAEITGEVVEVLVENGTPVQYGDPLFRVKTS